MASVDTVGVKYEADISALQKALEKIIAENKELKGQVDSIGKEYSQTTKEASKGVDDLNKKTGELKKSGGGLESTMKKAGAAMVAAFAVEKVIQFTKAVLDVSANFQKMEAVLTNTLGSQGAAQAAMKEIVDFASKTPFQVAELTDSFVKLANQGFIPTQEEMRKLGDLASSQGKGFDQLTEAIIDAETGEFERLKEFGIRASKEGDNVTFAFKGVETQTAFTADAMREYILSLGDAEGVSGSMAAVSDTLGGKFSNLEDATVAFQKEIGDKLNPIMIELMNIALEVMDNFDILTAPISELSDLTGELFASFGDLIGAFVDVSGDGIEVTDVMSAVGVTFRMSMIPIKLVIATIQLAVDSFRLIVNEGKKVANFFGADFDIDMGITPEKLREDAKKIGEAFSVMKKERQDGNEEIRKQEEENAVALQQLRWKKELEAFKRNAQKALEKKKQEQEKMAAVLLKQEFEAQELRIELMDEGIGKELAKRQLAYEKEKNAAKDNKTALLLIEKKFQKDLEDIQMGELLAELDSQEAQQKNEKEFSDSFLAVKEDELLTEIANQERQTAVDNEEAERRKEIARKNAEDRVLIAQSSFEAVSAIGNALIQDELKRAQFQKSIALFQIGVSTAEAIAKGIASASGVGFPANLIAIAATVATVFANIAQAKSILSSSNVPAFKDGVIDLQGPGTETSDSITARLSRRESVMTAKETKGYKDELWAIRKGKFEDLILSKYVLPALREDRKQRDTGANMARSLAVQSVFDDSGIINTLERNRPATSKDIKNLGKELSKGYKEAAYKQSKQWRVN